MKFKEVGFNECKIGYRVEITVESALKGYRRNPKFDKKTFVFNRANPYEARNASLVLAIGWINFLEFDLGVTGREFFQDPINISRALIYDKDKAFFYRIKVYCVLDDALVNVPEMVIYDSSVNPKIADYHSKMDELLEGLKWEYDLYQKYGFRTEGCTEINQNSHMEEVTIIRKGANMIDLQPFIEGQ